MEPNRPDPPPVEVLDTGRPPSRVGTWARAVWERRATKIAGTAAVVLLGTWAVVSLDGQPQAEARPDHTSIETKRTGPAPVGRRGGTVSWRVQDVVRIRIEATRTTVLLVAVNGAPTAQEPTGLQVTGRFVGRPRLDYAPTCEAVVRTRRGLVRHQGSVAPGDEVLVRCTDRHRRRGVPPRIDLASVRVSTVPCESSGRRSGT